MWHFRSAWIAAVVAAFSASTEATAAFVTYVTTDGSGHSASAKFDLTGSTLTITLANTGSAIQNNADVLNNLYFNISQGTLTSQAATVQAGESVYFNQNYAVGSAIDVGGEFAFLQSSFTASGNSYNVGIGSAGRNVLGAGDAPYSATSTGTLDDFLPGTPNAGTAPDGPTGGLVNGVSGGYSPNSFAFINNEVVFTLSVSNFSLSNVTRVGFAYGTGTSDLLLSVTTPTGPSSSSGPSPAPAPAGLVLLASAIPFVGLIRLRKAQ